MTLSEVHGNNWVEWDKDYLNYSEDTFQKLLKNLKILLQKMFFYNMNLILNGKN